VSRKERVGENHRISGDQMRNFLAELF